MQQVSKFLDNEQINNITPEGPLNENWIACDCCKTFADTYECTAYRPSDKEVLKYNICQSCLEEIN